MASADGTVLPKPGVPKTLGILSVIFSVILILVGICGLGSIVIAPAFMKFAEEASKQVQAKQEQQQQARIKELDEKAKAATTDEEKKSIQGQKDAVLAEPKVVMADMKGATDMLSDPTIKGFTIAYYATGLALHVLLLIAGIGLIRLTEWGRSLGVWWAGLMIAQILVMNAINFIYINPKQKAIAEQMFAKLEADAKAQGGAANPAMAGLQFGKAIQDSAGIFMIAGIVVSLAFPVVMLAMLNGAGAKAACRAGKPAVADEFGPGPGGF